MRLVVDANILVAELLRIKGKELVANKNLELFIADKAWEEAQHELSKRISIIAERGNLSETSSSELLYSAVNLAENHINVIVEEKYNTVKNDARARIPQDPDDWHTVALALMLNADIWTQDKDFFGCGVACWTSRTLKLKLGLDN